MPLNSPRIPKESLQLRSLMTEGEMAETRQRCRDPRLASFPLFFPSLIRDERIFLPVSHGKTQSKHPAWDSPLWSPFDWCQTCSGQTLHIFLKISKMGCRKELGSVPLNGVSSIPGFVILLSSDVLLLGDILGCPCLWEGRLSMWVIVQRAFRCLNDGYGSGATHTEAPSSPDPPASMFLQPYLIWLFELLSLPKKA